MMFFPRDLVTAPLINKVSDVLALISSLATPEHVVFSRESSEPGKKPDQIQVPGQYPDRNPVLYRIRVLNRLKLSLTLAISNSVSITPRQRCQNVEVV